MSDDDRDEEGGSWDDHAASWDSNEAVRRYAELAFASLQQKIGPLIDTLSSCRVLDFGCGTGLLTEKLAPLCREVVAVDASEKMIAELDAKIARLALPSVTTLAYDLETRDLNARDTTTEALREPFDLIVASSVCAFLSDYERTLQRLTGMLGLAGVLVQWDWHLGDDQEEGIGLSRQRILAALGGCAVEIVAVEPAFDIDHDGDVQAVIVAVARRTLAPR